MSERVDTARRTNAILRQQQSMIKTALPSMMNEGIVLANGSVSNARTFVGTLGDGVNLMTPRPWEVGMTTEPGDLVYDPERNHIYAFGLAMPMTHTNPLFYPGSAGVYHWLIVPKTKEGVKIYPDIQGIIVAVKQNELWWNVDQTAIFYWKGVDNPNCVWSPVEGNEWGLYTP